jgi:pimeloyl-ACP methyl ester carboxylesterase|tara:strand:- start:983 stop:2734 length:1752 start_codon:yes stop_codon:yes gene_type:complete
MEAKAAVIIVENSSTFTPSRGFIFIPQSYYISCQFQLEFFCLRQSYLVTTISRHDQVLSQPYLTTIMDKTTLIQYIASMSLQKYATLALTCFTLQGCEFGVDPGSSISPNYHLLSSCDKPDSAAIASLVADSLCGTISVFEDRVTKSGRKIDLNIMVIPAISPSQPDPIFFLAGGPGQSAVDVGPFLFSRLHRLRNERDIVLVDQRGTGKSNSLACELSASAFEQVNLSVAAATEMQIENLKKCLTEYDANTALYTTPIAMDDLNEVREVLGYSKINLLGISYGTRAGLVYIRRHQDTVRSAVLDAVAPLTMAIPKNVATDAQAAFERLVTDCKKQPGCKETYPHLKDHFRLLVQGLEQTPEEIALHHPRTGKATKGTIDSRLINRLVRAIMYDRTLSRLLPLAIEEAFGGNYAPLSTLAYTLTGEDTSLSSGMMASVLCAEDMTRVDAASNSMDFDNAIYEALDPICEFWPRGSVPEGYFEPVVSDIPVLLASGTLDPVTPPKYGWEASLTLSNSEHIVIPGVGHSVVTVGCMPDIVYDFFSHPEASKVSASCRVDLKRPPFFTSLAGPLGPGEGAQEEKHR